MPRLIDIKTELRPEPKDCPRCKKGKLYETGKTTEEENFVCWSKKHKIWRI